MHFLAATNDTTNLALLIKSKGSLLNKVDSDGRTALFYAVLFLVVASNLIKCNMIAFDIY